MEDSTATRIQGDTTNANTNPSEHDGTDGAGHMFSKSSKQMPVIMTNDSSIMAIDVQTSRPGQGRGS